MTGGGREAIYAIIFSELASFLFESRIVWRGTLAQLCYSWPEVLALYQQALQLPEGDRHTFLNDCCGVNTALYFEVRSLLAGTEPRVWIEY